MDSYREHPGDFEQQSSADHSGSNDVAAVIGTDERRMHVRAYNHWVSLLRGRDFPSIEDLEPDDVEDFVAIMAALDLPRPKKMDVAVPANRACGGSQIV